MSYHSGDFYGQVVERERDYQNEYQREQLERRHAWKTYLGLAIMIVISWVCVYTLSYFGILAVFGLMFVAKDFDPVPKDQRHLYR